MKSSELKQLIKEELQKVLSEGLFDRFKKPTIPNYKIVREFPLSDINKVMGDFEEEYEIGIHPDDDRNIFGWITKDYKKITGLFPFEKWRKDLSDGETIVALEFPSDSDIYFIAKKYL